MTINHDYRAPNKTNFTALLQSVVYINEENLSDYDLSKSPYELVAHNVDQVREEIDFKAFEQLPKVAAFAKEILSAANIPIDTAPNKLFSRYDYPIEFFYALEDFPEAKAALDSKEIETIAFYSYMLTVHRAYLCLVRLSRGIKEKAIVAVMNQFKGLNADYKAIVSCDVKIGYECSRDFTCYVLYQASRLTMIPLGSNPAPRSYSKYGYTHCIDLRSLEISKLE